MKIAIRSSEYNLLNYLAACAWAAPALLQRWVGILAVALQRANVASVQWACGERGQCPPVRGSVPQPYELFAERVPGGPQSEGLD